MTFTFTDDGVRLSPNVPGGTLTNEYNATVQTNESPDAASHASASRKRGDAADPIGGSATP